MENVLTPEGIVDYLNAMFITDPCAMWLLTKNRVPFSPQALLNPDLLVDGLPPDGRMPQVGMLTIINGLLAALGGTIDLYWENGDTSQPPSGFLLRRVYGVSHNKQLLTVPVGAA